MFSVLYVDDENDLLELGKLFLEQSPEFHVDIASSAKEALESLSVRSYNAIVSDYQMPEIDGIAFLKLVRRKYGNIPFILFTGRGREEIVIEAINNGADFYLQKGGDVRSQFAELSHKIRQAVARWQAEYSLIDSEKRLTDIINFLPDATLAINRQGVIIAWNRAIEEMTGLSADKMIGKGDHEYALPFYGVRRPILIDLIFEPADVIEKNYSHIVREKDVLKADTTLPHLHGKEVTLAGKASPLYNSQGELIGAIEAIRDITEQKNAEDELRAAYEQITASEEELRDQLDVLAESEQQVKESASRLQFMLGFYERAGEDKKMLLSYAVEGAGTVTGSPLGYLAFLNGDESQLTMYAWSKNAMEECSLREKPIIYQTEQTGLWGEAVRQRRAVITNDYAAPNPAKKGYPTGHPEIVRHMNIPVIDGGHIVMVAGVANKSQDYTDEDVKQLSLLMQGLWQVIKQRETKQELAKSEEKYRDLFENSVIGIFRTTPEGKLSAINTTFARIAGYNSTVEMLALIKDLRTQIYVNAQDRDRFLATISSEGIVKDFEARFYHRDGHPVWITLNAKAIRNAAGDIQYFEGTIEDIDEKKKIEGELLTEKTFSDTVIDSIPGLLYQYDSEGRLVRWNKSHETLTGYTAEELAGMNVLDWFRGDDEAIATITDGVSRALKEGEATAEAPLQTKNGKKIPFFFTAKRLEIDGKTYFTGVGIDITDRLRAQDEIREREATLASIFRAAPVGIGLVSNRVLLRVNERLCEMTGYSAEELIGRSARILYPDDEEFECVGRDKYELIRKSGTGTVETRWQRKDGAVRDILLSSTPLDPENLATGITFTALDITERKSAEEELRSAHEQLTASEEELRGQFDELAAVQGNLQKSREHLEEIANMVPGVIYQFYARQDGSRGVYYVSSRAEEIFGLDDRTQDFISWFTGRVDARDRESFHHSVTEVIKAGQPWNFEGRFIKPSGEKIWFQGISRPVARQGELVYSGVLLDITQRKLAEEALHESEEKYRTVIEQSQDGIFIAQDGLLVFHNPSFCTLTGYSSPELAGRSIADLIAPEDRDMVMTRHRERLLGNTLPDVYEFSVLHHDGISRILVKMSITSATIGGRPATLGTLHNVMEDRKREEALRISEDRFRKLISSSFDAIVVHQEGRIVLANDAAARIMGVVSTAELVGMPVIDLVYPEFRANVAERLQLILQSPEGTAPLIEEKFVCSDGTSVDVEVMATTTYHKEKPAVMVIFRDISGRKKAEAELLSAYQNLTATEEELRQQYEVLAQNEERLRVSEEKYRTLVETTSDFIWEVDESGTYKYVSPQVRELLGYEPEELIGKTPFDFMQPDEARRVTADFTRLIDSRLPISYLENRCIHKNGSIVVLETSGVPRLAKDGSFAGYRGIDRNITRRKHAEEALKESEEKYRTILNTTSEWIWDLDLDGRHTYSNNAVESLLGYTVDEFLGFRAFDLMHPEDKKQVEKIFTASVKERKGWRNLVTRWQNKDGTYRYLESNATTIFNERGELTGFRGADRDITDRKLAEEAIRNSEAALQEKSAMLEALFNAIPDVIGVQDLHHGIIRYNTAGYAMVGKNPGEVVGKRCFELIGHDAPCETCATSETYRTKKPAMVQKYVPEIKAWLDVRSYPVLDDSGDIQFIIEHLRDISGQKRAEEMIREKIEEINQYFATSIDLFSIADADGYFRRLNPEWEKTLGYTLAELEGKRLLDFVHPNDLQATHAAVANLSSQKGELNFTNRYRHKDGTYLWLEWRALSKGNLIYAAARDITDRKQVENAIREREVWARTILNTAQAGIIIIDAKIHQVIDANPTALDMIGLPRDSVIGMVCHRFICPTEVGRCPVTDCGQNVNTSERVLLAASGAKIPVLKTVVPVSMGGRNVLVESFVDISEQKRAEDSLREVNHKLNLLYSMTRHDVANQLTILQGYAQIAAMKKGDPVMADYLAKIMMAADTIAHQIEFTRTYQELGVKAPAWTQVENVIARVESRVPVTFSGTCRGIEILADPMLERVFFNLFDNAVRHGVRVTEITVRCEREPYGILVIVEDNGHGIPVAEKDRIFERGVGKNTGLGLFLVKEILSITGITIKETGVYGKGARFEISVPERMYRFVTTQ